MIHIQQEQENIHPKQVGVHSWFSGAAMLRCLLSWCGFAFSAPHGYCSTELKLRPKLEVIAILKIFQVLLGSSNRQNHNC